MLEKRGQVVQKLHFKGCKSKEEIDNFRDTTALDKTLNKTAETVCLVDADKVIMCLITTMLTVKLIV